ncbi:MAG: hydroxymethylbilane synthase, partial [Chloroflexi bacterium]|nr:hydroxymethylbilane synthase [Chloroflexota bacterium]
APLTQIGGKGIFIKELEEALLDESVDLAVHSVKDIPTETPSRLSFPAVCRRDDVRDCLVSNNGLALANLKQGARVGTSSLRRQAQLRHYRADLDIRELRGNVDTRLRKLRERQYDGIVLAAAGLRRLGVAVPPDAYVAVEKCLPAPGQAAICIETLAGGEAPVASLDHAPSRAAVEAERAFAAELDAGCTVPLGAYAVVDGADIWLRTVVAARDGARLIRSEARGSDPVELGRRVAKEALARGAGELLAAAR